MSGNFGFTVDTETYEASVFGGGSARVGAEAGFELSIQVEGSSKRGNSIIAEAGSDLSIGTGEETFASKAGYSADQGFEVSPLEMEQSLTIDKHGLSLKPNFGISAGVGGQAGVNVSLPDTAEALSNAIDNLSGKIERFMINCQTNSGSTC